MMVNDTGIQYRRSRYALTSVGVIVLILQLCLALVFARAVVHEVQTGSWAMLGAGVIVLLFQYALAVVGLLIAALLVSKSGFGRFGTGVPLLLHSVAMLYWNTPFVLGKWIAALYGYHK